MLKPSSSCTDLIRAHEGLRLKAYRCPGGYLTIGYGSTKGVRPSMEITEEEAVRRLGVDLQVAVDAVNRLVEVPLTQSQFDSLCSFVFNIGAGAFADSTMLSLINQRAYDKAAEEFSKWVFSKGNRLKGLIERRKAEKALFLKDSIQ